MPPLILLHTNDIHGHIEHLARIATLVERVRAENPDAETLYFDIGDIEENSVQISDLTKGVGMHRLLSLAGCQAAAVGNGGLLRYSPPILREYAAAASYPLLLANLRHDGQALPGTRTSTLLQAGEHRLGLIGLTADLDGVYTRYFDLETLSPLPLVRELAADLRRQGADAVIVLSHMGLLADRELAQHLQGEVDIILGAHTHDLLPEGEWVGGVLLAQAGWRGEQVGRLDLGWEADRLHVRAVSMLPITDEIEPAPVVLSAVGKIENEVNDFLSEIIGELAQPLDFAEDRECGVANLMADMLREREQAEVAVVAAGNAFTAPLPAGPLTRRTLWEASVSSANPGAVMLTGEQLTHLVARGLDPEFARERPRALRGRARGLFHLSGACMRNGELLIAGQPVEPQRTYRVAGSDWELDGFGGYADPEWRLRPRYDITLILREALAEYLAAHRPTRVEMGRLG